MVVCQLRPRERRTAQVLSRVPFIALPGGRNAPGLAQDLRQSPPPGEGA
jgi:hypothetical protein